MTRLTIAAVLLFAAAPGIALAADPTASYTFNANTVLLDESGQPARDPQACKIPATKDTPAADCAPLTVGVAIGHVLFFGGYKDQTTVTAETMWARYALANRIRTNGHASLSGPEITLIEMLMPQYYPSPVVMGQVAPLIDPNGKPGPIK